MPVEIEAKMKLGATDAVLKRLTECGAAPVGSYLETNTFFDTEDRALLARDQGLRVRVSRDLNTGKVSCVVTHKGPNQYGQLKQRQETELEVGDADDAARLLNQLGFVRYLSFQKKRQSWKLDGCKVELDEVPYLGHFIEIEGPSEETVMKVREKLGLSHLALIKSSYIAMLVAYLQEKGQSTQDVVFPSIDPAPRLSAKAG